jgi:thiol-disulfide isomerase/thioredoxin
MDAMSRRRRLGRLPLFLCLAATAAVAGCSGHDAVKQDVSGTTGYVGGNLALTYVSAGHRHAPSAVTGKLLDGSAFDLASWRGKVVVVNFWGSWCSECRDEARALEQVYADDAGKGVEFVGVDIRDDVPSAQDYQRKYAITYPSLNDPDNLLALRFRGVPPNATPTTLILDRSVRIAARQSGSILYPQLRDLVNRVLAEPA